MREQYIPDLTERFPEGFGGVDMTNKYFPCETKEDLYALESAMWEQFMGRDVNYDEMEEDFALLEVN